MSANVMLTRRDITFRVYKYDFKEWPAVLSVVLFSIVTLALLSLSMRTKSWHFWPMSVGAAIETIGYILRLASALDSSVNKLSTHFMHNICLMIAPSFIAFACYNTFARLIWLSTPPERRNFDTLWCSPQFITMPFVSFDLISFIIQTIGNVVLIVAMSDGYMSYNDLYDNTVLGITVLRIGLAFHLLCYMILLVVAVRFAVISHKWPKRALIWDVRSENWQRLNSAIIATVLGLIFRVVFRIVMITNREKDVHYLGTHEWTFWVIEALPIFAILVSFTIFHPSRYLPAPLKVMWLGTTDYRLLEHGTSSSHNQVAVRNATAFAP